MKEPRPLPAEAREAALQALLRMEQDGAYLNLALPPLLEKLNKEDKGLAVQLARGTVQRLNTLDWALNYFSHRPVRTLVPWLRNLLRLSAYQLLFLDRIPGYAAVDQAVRLAWRYGNRGTAGLANAVLRRMDREKESLPWPAPEEDFIRYLSLTYSYPLWLAARVVGRMGVKRAEKWCRAGNDPALTAIRPNSLRVTPEKLINLLEGEGFAARKSEQTPGMLLVTSGGRVAETKSFKDGLFTIQGESSGLVAPLLQPRPEKTIIDLCSAPGGKTTHLAELSGDRGRIIALDRHEKRLQLVSRAAERLGLKSISTICADGRSAGDLRLPAPEAVLVDAPCSGIGVIRRLPEIKWRRSEDDFLGFQKQQTELLTAAGKLLRPGGRLLYSVCTNEPEETTQVADIFEHGSGRKEFTRFDLSSLLPGPLQQSRESDTAIHLYPDLHGMDGFFIVLWEKSG